jgi:hypothetical protein
MSSASIHLGQGCWPLQQTYTLNRCVLLPRPSPPLLHQETLAREVMRKLRLAADAETKEDRDVVCCEVFADITGELNSAARGERGAACACV